MVLDEDFRRELVSKKLLLLPTRVSWDAKQLVHWCGNDVRYRFTALPKALTKKSLLETDIIAP